MVGSHKLNNTSSRLCEQPTVALPLLSAGILSGALLFHARTRHHRLAQTEKTGEDEAGGKQACTLPCPGETCFPHHKRGFHTARELPRGVLRLRRILPKKLADITGER